MELHEALTQISEIRQQIARTEVFRGYRSIPVAFSGVLAFATAYLQVLWLPEPAQSPGSYFALWISAAAISVMATGAEIVLRARRSASPLTGEITWLAVEQFIPCVVAGGLVTFVLHTSAPESLWIMPGLWQILFSLGIFASYRLLPRPVYWVGVFYLMSGVLCLVLARNESAFSPWAMGLPFGVGQLLAAGVLYWTLERNHGTQQEPEAEA
jgi:hypothetical protein